MERVNYPSNCFTLNIKKDTEEEANGIIRITFFLKRPESADSKETKKLQNLFWLPLIQIHTGTDTTDGYIISIQIQRPSGEMENIAKSTTDPGIKSFNFIEFSMLIKESGTNFKLFLFGKRREIHVTTLTNSLKIVRCEVLLGLA